MTKKFAIPIPHTRKMGASFDEELLAQSASPSQNGNSGEHFVRDMILHAAIARIAYTDDTTMEFHTKFNPETLQVELDIDEESLNYLMNCTVGPNLEAYFSWLTNQVVNLRRDTLQFTIGSDSTIAAGLQGIGLQVGFDAVIERVDMFTSTTGSIELGIWKTTPDNYPPDSSGSITGGFNPSIVNSNYTSMEGLDNWVKTLSRGDIIFYNVESAVDVSLVTVVLHICRYSITS